MDEIDIKILDCLKKNSRSTASEISKKVFLSVPAVTERIRKLEEKGIINQYTVRINKDKLGYKLLAIVFVNINETEKIDKFRKEIIKFPEVMECLHMAGEYDYMLKVLTKDTSELEDFLTNKMKSINGVGRTNTLIALSILKDEINR